MAIRASCDHCRKNFTAPEQYRGRKIECPSCHRRFVLKSADDQEDTLKEEAAAQRKKDEDREKLALIERMDSRGERRSGRPYYEMYQTGREGVRHFNPRSPSRYSRMRALSDFLVLGAYLEILLACVGMGLVVYLRIAGVFTSLPVLFLLIVAWLIVGTGLFLFLKYLGELTFLLADVGDQQNDAVQLLMDLRDNTDEQES